MQSSWSVLCKFILPYIVISICGNKISDRTSEKRYEWFAATNSHQIFLIHSSRPYIYIYLYTIHSLNFVMQLIDVSACRRYRSQASTPIACSTRRAHRTHWLCDWAQARTRCCCCCCCRRRFHSILFQLPIAISSKIKPQRLLLIDVSCLRLILLGPSGFEIIFFFVHKCTTTI